MEPGNIIATEVMVLATTLLMKVGIDLIGPLPKTARGNKYIITLVDYFSKWPEAEPIPDKSAKSVAAFLYRMICRLVYVIICMHVVWSDFILDMVVLRF